MPLLNPKAVEEALKRGNLIYYEKENIFFTKEVRNMPTIVNVPLGKNLRPKFEEAEVEHVAKRVCKGQHTKWTLIKYDRSKRRLVQREVLT